MKIAVVYNEPYKELTDPYAVSCPPNFKDSEIYKLRQCDILEEYKLIADSLVELGYESYCLNIMDNLDIFFNDLNKNKPDVILNLVELYKDDAKLEVNFAALLQLLNVAFTGCNAKSLSLCKNKFNSKQILKFNGINVPNNVYFDKIEENYNVNLKFPVIVKPIAEDGSIGIDEDSIIEDETLINEKIRQVIKKYKQPAIVEEYIEGREFNVAILEGESFIDLPISEIDFSTMPKNYKKIVGFNAKWSVNHICYKTTIPICPANIDLKTEEKIKHIAKESFIAMECNGYARVDFRMDNSGNLYVLEVNPNPDLSIDAGLYRACKIAGFSYSEMLNILIKNALIKS